MSLHVTQFYQAFPALVLQVTNTGVRRPGYEATISSARAIRDLTLDMAMNCRYHNIHDASVQLYIHVGSCLFYCHKHSLKVQGLHPGSHNCADKMQIRMSQAH